MKMNKFEILFRFLQTEQILPNQIGVDLVNLNTILTNMKISIQINFISTTVFFLNFNDTEKKNIFLNRKLLG